MELAIFASIWACFREKLFMKLRFLNGVWFRPGGFKSTTLPSQSDTKTWISLSKHIYILSQWGFEYRPSCLSRDWLLALRCNIIFFKCCSRAEICSCVFVYISFFSVFSAGFLPVSICALWWETETTCVEVEKKEQLGFSLPSATVLFSSHLFALFSYLAQGHLYTLLAQPDSFQVISESFLFYFCLATNHS